MNLPKLKIDNHKKYYFVYTVLFAITSVIVYYWYLAPNRTFIWREDGWQQHYKALIYYSQYLRSIIKGVLFQHELVTPDWDFAIGQGSDILGTLHYYTIGDPLSVFSVFFSADNMYKYYDIATVLRMFLSGITFSMLCFGMGRRNYYAVLAGSMTYVFCEYIYYSIHHPYFLNPIIYFPLIILGIEKILNKKRAYLFIASVALCSMSSFYFFYMIALATVIYVITRFVILYRRNLKEAAQMLLKIALSSVLGVMISAVIFMPLCYVFIGDSRISQQFALRILYPLEYYSKLPRLFVSTGSTYFSCLGFAVPVLLAVFLMYYNRKKYKLTSSLFVICLIILLFPIFGRIFNGFAYMTNRWIWAFALLCSYILVLLWQPLMNLNAKEGIFLFKCLSAYFILCLILEYSRAENALGQIILAFILLFVLFPVKELESFFTYTRKQQFTLALVILSVILNSLWKTAPNEGNEAGTFMEVKQLALDANETGAIAEAAESEGREEFYRYSGRNLTENANMLAGISSTQYYWSLINPNIADYRSRLTVLENRSFDPSNLDDRAGLTSLASVLYYSIPANDSAPAPYGFTYIDSPSGQSAYKIYRNDYALPLAYTYNNYIKEETFNTLSSVEKEETMLQSVVLSEAPSYASEGLVRLSSYELPYTITCNSNEVSVQDNSFVVTAPDATATITFDGPPESETFLTITGMDFKETSKYDLYYGEPSLDPLDLYNDAKWDSMDYNSQYTMKKDKLYWSDAEHPKTAIALKSSNDERKTLQYFTSDYSFYSDRHDFAVNFNSVENGITSIELSFNLRGVYSFDSLKIICQPMNNYVNQITSLKEHTLQNTEIGTDSVTGTISLDTPGILCFSIPYSSGWKAYVDSVETKLYQANIMNMAVELDAGEHEIRLEYRTPYLQEGIYVSLIGLVIFIAFIFIYERRIRKK